MIAAAANAGPVTYVVAAALIDASFLLAVEGSVAIRKEIFTDTFGMTYGTIPPDDPDGLGVYYLDPSIWDEVNAYIDEFGTTCAEPCKILTYSS